MGKFNLILTIIFGISMFLILNNLYVSNIYNHFSDVVAAKNFNEYDKSNLSLIFLGDSHVMNSIIPSYFLGSYNFGRGSETLDTTKIKVDNLIVEDDGIKTYVLQYDLHLFSDPDEIKVNHLNTLNFKFNKTPSMVIRDYFPVIGNMEQVIPYLIYGSSNPIFYQGYQNKTKIFDQDLSKTKYRVFVEFVLHKKNPNSISDYISILKTLKSNHKQVILIKYPVSNQYLEELNKVENISEEYKLLNETLDLNGYVILDYSNIFNNSQEYFADMDHLNYQGAKEFSRIVVNDLEHLRHN